MEQIQPDTKIVIFDLDGTVADCQHRIHHITPANGLHEMNIKKDWRAFFAACVDDKPIQHMIDLMRVLAWSHEVWIVSGRSDECKEATQQWLKDHKVSYHKLIMRKEGDYTDDSILKPQWLKDGTIPQERVLCVFDDRTRVVRGWRKAGVPCFQVAEGDF